MRNNLSAQILTRALSPTDLKKKNTLAMGLPAICSQVYQFKSIHVINYNMISLSQRQLLLDLSLQGNFKEALHFLRI